MVMRYRTSWCECCQSETSHQADRVHHAAHIAFSLMTLVWVAGYVAALIRDRDARWKCTRCGSETSLQPQG